MKIKSILSAPKCALSQNDCARRMQCQISNLSIAEPQPIKDEVNSRAERLFDLFENFL